MIRTIADEGEPLSLAFRVFNLRLSTSAVAPGSQERQESRPQCLVR